jgi:hypothetical protein
MFMVDKNYQIRQRTSQFFAAQLMTQEWAEQGDAEHQLFRAESDIKDADGHTLVTAYALKRPDGQWSLLLINKDFDHAHQFRLKFHDESVGVDRFLTGPVTAITFGKAEYQWHSDRKNGSADPDGPPVKSSLSGVANTQYTLAPASLTILRGRN